MARFLLGLFVGVVATYAILTQLDTSPDETPVTQAGPSAAAESASAPDPTTMTADAADTSQAATQSPRLKSASPPKGTYDAYSPEIAEMLETRVPSKLQQRYESEAREESWATYMEGQFAAYFAQKPELAQFNISLIDCRSSICEIHAVGYGPDARSNWITATSDIGQQPWHQFNQGSMSTRDVQPDVFAVVWILARNTP